MKISWGIGISITIVVFMLLSFWLIYFSFSQDVNLVRDDYYQAEVQFDDKLEILKRTDQLEEKLIINIKSTTIEYRFPKFVNANKIKGNIILYRPSSADQDFSIPIKLDSTNAQSVSIKGMISGLWKTQVDWQIDSIKYFNEKTIMVP